MIDRLARSPLGRFPLAPFVPPMIVMITLWRGNANRLGYEDVLPSAVVVTALCLALLVALRALAGSWIRAGTMLAVAGVYCLYAPQLTSRLATPAIEAIALLVAALVAIDLARRIPRDIDQLLRPNAAINLAAIPLLGLLLGLTLVGQQRLEAARPETAALFPAFKGDFRETSPDVWHIVLDRYASADTLRRVYGYDNSGFLAALRARGFDVGTNVSANYQRTGHSLASTLNASYLDPIAAGGKLAGNDWVPIYRSVRTNRALQFFADGGYRTIFAGTWWSPTQRNARADENINFRALPEFGRAFLDQTVVGRVLDLAGLPYGDPRTDQCLREPRKFAALREIAGENDRKYVFAHFLVPHPPYVLNPDGSCRSLDEAEAASRSENYLGQLEYANRELLRLVDAIRAGPRPATIILQSDEGPWPSPHIGDERFIGRDPVAVDWVALDAGRLREKMGVFMAIRHADGTRGDVPETPVNIYPSVLRHGFGGAMPDRPDRNLIFVSNDRLYTFRDVTGVLRGSPLADALALRRDHAWESADPSRSTGDSGNSPPR